MALFRYEKYIEKIILMLLCLIKKKTGTHKAAKPLIKLNSYQQKFKKDPYTTTLGGFSKVTNYIFDAFRPTESECLQRPAEEVADILGELIPGLEINQQEEPGFEVITRVSSCTSVWLLSYNMTLPIFTKSQQ